MIQQQRLMVDSMGKKAETMVQPKKVMEMETNNQISKWLVMLVLVIASAMGVMGQENQDPKQNACPGPEPYRVEVLPLTGNDYLWTVIGGVVGTDYTITNTTIANTVITWVNPAATKIFTVTFKEIDPITGCYDEVNVEVTVNPLPNAPVITGAPLACQYDEGAIYSTPNVAGHTYAWVVSGGVVTAGAGTNQITVTWDTAGAGTVEVTEIVSATTCSATSSIPVQVNPAPVPAITGLGTVCQNQAGTTYSTPVVSGHTYIWAVTGGTVTAGAATNEITVTWNTAGAGTVEVTETITSTTCATTVNIPVLVNPAPAPVIAGLATVCQNQTGAIYSTPDVSGHSYVWVVTGGTITAGAGTNQITVTWNTAGAGTVEVTETITSTSCSTTVNIPVLVNPAPAPAITGLGIVCQNQTGVSYSTPNVSGHTYLWAVTGGTVTAGAGTNQITVTWDVSGGGIVEVTETITSTTCASTVNIPVLVNPAPAPLIAGLATVCQNQTGITYSTPNVSGNTYVWAVTGGTITAGAGTNQITVTWTTAGVGIVEVTETITSTTCASTVNIPVFVNPAPTPVIAGLVIVCQNQSGVTYSTPDVLGHTYVWAVTGGTVTAGAGTNQITVSWTTTGAGTVEVTETITSTSCATTVNIPVLVNPAPVPVIAGLGIVCQGQASVTYSTPDVSGHTYVWAVTGGTVTAGAGTNEITVTWNTAGAGTVEVTETITSTTCATSVNIPVLVNPAPAPVIAGLAIVCQNQTGVTYSTPDVSGHSYVWAVTGGTVTAGAGTNEITVTWDTAGAGTVEVTETITSTSCTTTVNIPVLVNPAPLPVIAGKTIVCQNEAGVIYSTPVIAGHTFTWVVTGGTVTAGAGTNEITVTWTTVGNGKVEVTETVTSSTCAAMVNIPVLVNPTPTTSPIFHN